MDTVASGITLPSQSVRTLWLPKLLGDNLKNKIVAIIAVLALLFGGMLAATPAVAKDAAKHEVTQPAPVAKKIPGYVIQHVVDAGDWDPPIVIWCANGNRYNLYEGHSSTEFCGNVEQVYNYADSKIQVKVELGASTDGWVDAYTYYGWQPTRPVFTKHRTTRA